MLSIRLNTETCSLAVYWWRVFESVNLALPPRWADAVLTGILALDLIPVPNFLASHGLHFGGRIFLIESHLDFF